MMPKLRGVIGPRLAALRARAPPGYEHGRVRRRLPAQPHDWFHPGGRRVVRLRLVSISAAGASRDKKESGQETVHHVRRRTEARRLLGSTAFMPETGTSRRKRPDVDPRHVSPPRHRPRRVHDSRFLRGGRLRDGQHELHHPFEAEPLHAERLDFGLTGGEPRPSR